MLAKSLIIVGLVWLLVVVIALRYGPDSGLILVWSQHPLRNPSLLASSLVKLFLIVSFVLGWTVPLGAGVWLLIWPGETRAR